MFNIPSHSFYAMLVVIILLIVASIARVVKQAAHPTEDDLELKLRIQSWWWIVGLLFIVLIVNDVLAIIFFAFVSFLALKEFLSIVPTRQADRRVVFWAYVAIPLQYFWVGEAWYGMFIIFIPVYLFLLMPMRMVLIGETKGFINAAGVLSWGTMLTVFSISHIAFLLVLPEKNAAAGNVGLVLYLLFATEFNDICQYLCGKTFGKHKIIPKVSPNKTWEGFLGGVLISGLVAVAVAPLLTPLNYWQSLGAGLLIACAGFIGDVVMSSVKRDLQIKDSGNLIPGHGGVLDRLDSLIYTSPLFFHYLYFFHY